MEPMTMMAIAKTALSAGQMIKAGIDKRKRDQAKPTGPSSYETGVLRTLRRARRASQTGTGGVADRAAARQMAKSALRSSFRAGGPVNQGFYSNLMSQTLGNIAKQEAAKTTGLMTQEVAQSNRLGGITRDLALLDSTQASADAAAGKQGGMQNLMATLPDLFGMGKDTPDAT